VSKQAGRNVAARRPQRSVCIQAQAERPAGGAGWHRAQYNTGRTRLPTACSAGLRSLYPGDVRGGGPVRADHRPDPVRLDTLKRHYERWWPRDRDAIRATYALLDPTVKERNCSPAREQIAQPHDYAANRQWTCPTSARENPEGFRYPRAQEWPFRGKFPPPGEILAR